MLMKKVLLILLLAFPIFADAQSWKVDWSASTRFAGSTGEYMPFWARTGEDGILPVRSSALLTAGADLSYNHSNGIFFETGANLVGALSLKSPVDPKAVYGFVDRLYVSAGWKMLHMDLGLRPRERELSDLSISGGNIIYSRNARNIPGVNFWSDWIYFEKGHWFGLKGNIAHYQYIDNRYVKGAYIHNKALSAKIALGHNVDISGGLEHWAQWGGDSPIYGKQPVSLHDYFRVFLSKHGGEGSSESDRINALGNHLGREYVRLDWRHSRFTMSFQYDKPFEDGSGLRLQNVPDGIWSIQCSLNDRDAAVTDIVFEYINTTWQSGPLHDRPATEEEMAKQDPDDYHYGRVILRGCDNYFGNGEYMSGWTNHGRIVGLPLILSAAPGADGVVVSTVNTRVRAFHAGLKGNLTKGLPYEFRGTFSWNYGIYFQKDTSVFVNRPLQLSVAFNLGLKRFTRNFPIDMNVGLYGDVGQLYENSAGLTLRIAYSDLRRF